MIVADQPVIVLAVHLHRGQPQHEVGRPAVLPREFWLEAGKQGLLGLEVPEEYGGTGAGDYRFNAVLTEELAKVNMALPLVPRHPRRHRGAVPRRT